MAPRSEAATGRALVSGAGGCNVCTARADVAQLVEQRFRNIVFAPRKTFAPSHGCEHERTVMTKNDRGTVNMVSTTQCFRRCTRRELN